MQDFPILLFCIPYNIAKDLTDNIIARLSSNRRRGIGRAAQNLVKTSEFMPKQDRMQEQDLSTCFNKFLCICLNYFISIFALFLFYVL